MRYSHVLNAECPLKLWSPAIRPDEHILREVARVLVIADKPITQLIDLALVPLDDDVECLALPGEARLDERAIVGRVGSARSVGRAVSVRSRSRSPASAAAAFRARADRVVLSMPTCHLDCRARRKGKAPTLVR